MTKLQIAGTFIDYPISSFSELALGNIPGHSIVNKFGEAPSGVQTTTTDIWSRADATIPLGDICEYCRSSARKENNTCGKCGAPMKPLSASTATVTFPTITEFIDSRAALWDDAIKSKMRQHK